MRPEGTTDVTDERCPVCGKGDLVRREQGRKHEFGPSLPLTLTYACGHVVQPSQKHQQP